MNECSFIGKGTYHFGGGLLILSALIALGYVEQRWILIPLREGDIFQVAVGMLSSGWLLKKFGDLIDEYF